MSLFFIPLKGFENPCGSCSFLSLLKCIVFFFFIKLMTLISLINIYHFILEIVVVPNITLQNRLCEVVLGSTMISKMVSEPLQDSLGHLLSGFCYRVTHHLCLQTKLNSTNREDVC